MAASEQYRRQAALLVRTIPLVATETCFALKGGTAINLFVRDMPRLSVDIDLTYLPVEDRASSLVAIDAALRRIAGKVRTGIPERARDIGNAHRREHRDQALRRGGRCPDQDRGDARPAWLRV